MQTESNTFNISKSEQVRNDLARLKGARYVTAIEAGKGKRLDESLVKQLTGGDRIAARFLFKEYFEYKPEFKIWWAFNHKPVINDTTQSIWDRVKLIPFTITIPPEERDKDLPIKLLKELSGIINWGIEGLKEYRRIGLAEPTEVSAATTEYREEQDLLGDFFRERCNFESSGFVSVSDLYNEYTKWCIDNWEKPISKHAFGQEMNNRPVKREKHPKTKQRGYRGISL
jgi:putative DNA primase/helicase